MSTGKDLQDWVSKRVWFSTAKNHAKGENAFHPIFPRRCGFEQDLYWLKPNSILKILLDLGEFLRYVLAQREFGICNSK